MARLPRTLALLAAGVAGLAAAELASCSSGQCPAAEALAAEQGGTPLVLLQQKSARSGGAGARSGGISVATAVGRERQGVNTTALWDQLVGAVEIEDLEMQLQNLTNGTLATQLQEKLSLMKEAFPGADEVKAQFAGQWDQVRTEVNLETVQEALEKAKAQGSTAVESLQAKYDELKVKLPEFDLQSAKDQAAGVWAQLQEQGATLPDLDSLEAKARSAANEAYGQAKALAASAQDAASNAMDSLTGALGGFFR